MGFVINKSTVGCLCLEDLLDEEGAARLSLHNLENMPGALSASVEGLSAYLRMLRAEIDHRGEVAYGPEYEDEWEG